jgi:hypothetical protein
MDSFPLRSFLYSLCYDTITASIWSPRTILSKSCVTLSFFLETCSVTDRSCRLTSERVFCTEAKRWLEWRSSRCPTLLLLLYFPITTSDQHNPYQHACPYHLRRSEFTEYVYWRVKHKACRIVAGAENYNTSFGFHSIPDTAERLVLFQLLHVTHWPTHTLQLLPTYREC